MPASFFRSSGFEKGPSKFSSCQIPRSRVKVGNDLFNQGKYEEAIAAYDKLAALDEISETSDNKGISLYKLGRNNEAVEWYDSHNPISSEAWYIYGRLLKSMGLDAQAEYAFDQVR